jgi:N-acetylneuraminate synthase
MNLEFVQPMEEHARLVMAWRNDPVTLSMSFHKTPKQWPAFYEEFQQNYFINDSLPPLFGVVDGERVGFLRFRLYEGFGDSACDISIMIAPQHRGKGYGSALVVAGTALIHEKGWKTVVAEVLLQNVNSIRMFVRCGYQQVDEYYRMVSGLPHPITVFRFIHQED